LKNLRFWPSMLAAVALTVPLSAEEIDAPEPSWQAATAIAAAAEPSQDREPNQSQTQNATQNANQDANQNAKQDATQNKAALPDNPGAARDEEKKPGKTERVLGLAPSYGVVNNPATAKPLTPRQKFRLFYRQATDPYHFISIGISAGFGQATDSLPEYGQGAQGYGKRYGAALADSTAAGFFGTFLLPSLLHEDPRYFRQGSGTTRSRLWHAAKTSLITRHDDGSRCINYSNIVSGFFGSAIGNAYYPEQERELETTLQRGADHIPTASINAIVSEFWPDIHDRIFKKKKK
jgi:hypothetical protein